METSKKQIIAGVGLLGAAAIAYALTRKGPTPPPQTYKCPYCAETFRTYAELLAHIQAEHPTQPPIELGSIWGYIKDATTGERISGAKVYLDDVLQYISDQSGAYTTSYVPFGSHMLSIEADNYMTETVTVNIDQENIQFEVLLNPISSPTEWTEGITIRDVQVEPMQAYLGQTIDIKVYIDYPYPLPPLPVTIQGSAFVDGEMLTNEWILSSYDTVLHFSYTPSSVGTYTVAAKSKSTTFVVAQDIPAHYYSPFGGVRTPLVTDIIIPDVPAFTEGSLSYPGGDIRYSELFAELIHVYYVGIIEGQYTPITTFEIWWPWIQEILDRLPYAYPVKTYPSDAVIKEFTAVVKEKGTKVDVYATDYDCQEYWDTKEEIAEMIARSKDIMDHVVFDKVNMTQGIKNWIYSPSLDSPWIPGLDYKLCAYCPYCGIERGIIYRNFRWSMRLDVARMLLEHIEQSHPTHPLTEPAWF